MDMTWFLLTAMIAIIGGYAALRLKVPAGALIGSMVAVTLFNLLFEKAVMPADMKLVSQIATGAYIGARISKREVADLKRILLPACIMTVLLIGFTAFVGYLIHKTQNLDMATALFCMAPGGIADMTLAAMDFHADVSVVALLQTIRLIFLLLALPPVIRYFRVRQQEDGAAKEQGKKTSSGKGIRWQDLFLTLVVGAICGVAGKRLGVPAGGIVFSMAGCIVFNILTERGYMPVSLRRFVQMLAGALIGTSIGRQEVLRMREMWPVVLMAMVCFLVIDLVASSLIVRFTQMDRTTALFSCSPGGMTDLTLLSEEYGADTLKVAGMHMVRMISVVAFYPLLISLLMKGV